jgi:hypothetical protein
VGARVRGARRGRALFGQALVASAGAAGLPPGARRARRRLPRCRPGGCAAASARPASAAAENPAAAPRHRRGSPMTPTHGGVPRRVGWRPVRVSTRRRRRSGTSRVGGGDGVGGVRGGVEGVLQTEPRRVGRKTGASVSCLHAGACEGAQSPAPALRCGAQRRTRRAPLRPSGPGPLPRFAAAVGRGRDRAPPTPHRTPCRRTAATTTPLAPVRQAGEGSGSA